MKVDLVKLRQKFENEKQHLLRKLQEIEQALESIGGFEFPTLRHFLFYYIWLDWFVKQKGQIKDKAMKVDLVKLRQKFENEKQHLLKKLQEIEQALESMRWVPPSESNYGDTANVKLEDGRIFTFIFKGGDWHLVLE